MDYLSIYETIRELAHSLTESGQTFTRADLAFELAGHGIGGDSIEIEHLVHSAYEHSGHDLAILTSFVTNDHRHTLVDHYQMTHLMDSNETSEALILADSHLEESKIQLQQLSQLLNFDVDALASHAASWMGLITATSHIDHIRKASTALFERYGQLIDNYTRSRVDVETNIADYEALREQSLNIFRRYSTRLIDVFGDGIRTIDPELFDFDTVTYLPTDDMHAEIQLTYESLISKCANLISGISQNFSAVLAASTKDLRRASKKSVGLTLAGIRMISFYLTAGSRSKQMQREYVILRDTIIRDIALLHTDHTRLQAIIDTLGEIYIPAAKVFYEHAPHVLDAKLEQLLDTIYNADPEIALLSQEREKIDGEVSRLRRLINDINTNINAYDRSIRSLEYRLNVNRSAYNKAISIKPSKPSWIANVFSLGGKMRRYRRELVDWTDKCQPVIDDYEEARVELSLDRKEVDTLTARLADYTADLQALDNRLNDINARIRSLLVVRPEVIDQLAPHVQDIVSLLYTAKAVASGTLDDSLAKATKVEYTPSKDKTMEMAAKVGDWLKENNINILNTANATEATSADAPVSSDTLVDNAVSLLGTYIKLRRTESVNATGQNAYYKTLSDIRTGFYNILSSNEISKQQLAHIVSRIENADTDEIVDCLSELSGEMLTITRDDVEDMLRGTSQITI